MDISIIWSFDAFYILSQVFTILFYILLSSTYLVHSRKKLLFLGLTALLFSGTSYIFLSAWSAVVMAGVGLARNVAYIIHDKNTKKSNKTTPFDIAVFSCVVIAAVITSALTFDGFLSLFSVFGTVLYSFSVCQKNIRIYRIIAIPVGVLWITYNIFVGSIFGILLEALMLGAVIASVAFYEQIAKLKDKKKPEVIKN